MQLQVQLGPGLRHPVDFEMGVVRRPCASQPTHRVGQVLQEPAQFASSYVVHDLQGTGDALHARHGKVNAVEILGDPCGGLSPNAPEGGALVLHMGDRSRPLGSAIVVTEATAIV